MHRQQQYEERTAKLKADVPQLEAIISKQWGKEDELKQLKSDLAALDRKITAELAPTHEVPDDQTRVNHDETDGEEVKQSDTDTQRVEVRDNKSQTADSKESMVAEPLSRYQIPVNFPRSAHRSTVL